MSQYNLFLCEEEIDFKKVVELATIFGIDMIKSDFVITGYEKDTTLMTFSTDIIAKMQGFSNCKSFDDFIKQKKNEEVENAEVFAKDKERFAKSGIIVSPKNWLPARKLAIENDKFLKERRDYWVTKSFIDEFLKKHDSICVLAFWSSQNVEDSVKVRVLKNSIIKKDMLTIETLAFLPYNTLLKITK
jgi:hypothetical protein